MSLEHELVELNGAYQNTVATNMDLRERIQELEALTKAQSDFIGEAREHIQQLEQKIKDYQQLIEDYDELSSWAALPSGYKERLVLQQRAKELLS